MQDYTGIVTVELTEDELANFYQNKKLNIDLFNNQYILLIHNEKIIDKYRFINGNLEQVKKRKFKNTEVLPPLDEIQKCAYDMLFQEDIKCCCLIGLSGTGKTKTAISVGLELLKQGIYEKLILIRHAEETGKSIGLLPGTKDEKLINGWAGCFYDNLPGNKYEFEELLKTGRIEIDSLSLLKGRNFQNCFIIFDECEDAFPEHIELVGSRINDNCKLVFCGDYKQTSNRKYCTNSGLLKLIDKAKGKEWFGVIELQTNGRGRVAQFFATEFKE